jgi:type II secretory pathway pseudopilin PulG
VNPVKNDKGFQLIEIILSITLLSVILLVFFGYFQQAQRFSIQNETSASASQLSQEILEEVRSSSLSAEKLNEYTNGTYNTEINKQHFYTKVSIQPALDNIKKYPFNQSYVDSLFFLDNLDPLGLIDLLENLTNIEITNNLQSLQFIKVEISVDKNGIREKIYETYGYKSGEQL